MELEAKDIEVVGTTELSTGLYSLDLSANKDGVQVNVLVNGSIRKRVSIYPVDGKMVLKVVEHGEEDKQEVSVLHDSAVDAH